MSEICRSTISSKHQEHMPNTKYQKSVKMEIRIYCSVRQCFDNNVQQALFMTIKGKRWGVLIFGCKTPPYTDQPYADDSY